jgi:hypothetical protein
MHPTSPHLRELADRLVAPIGQPVPAEYVVGAGGIVDKALSLEGAFSGPVYDMLRMRIVGLKVESPTDWKKLAWIWTVELLFPHLYAFGWDAFRAVADCFRAEADRLDKPPTPPDGPDPSVPDRLWWKGEPYDLKIMPAEWALLKVLWGRCPMSVTDVAAALGKPSLLNGRKTLARSLNRLKGAMIIAKLPHTWSKVSRQDRIECSVPESSPTSS